MQENESLLPEGLYSFPEVESSWLLSLPKKVRAKAHGLRGEDKDIIQEPDFSYANETTDLLVSTILLC